MCHSTSVLKIFKFYGHNMLFLLSMKNKLDILKTLSVLHWQKEYLKQFFLTPRYFYFEFKTLHTESSKLAYETVT